MTNEREGDRGGVSVEQGDDMMAELPKIDSEGLRRAKEEGAERVSSATNVCLNPTRPAMTVPEQAIEAAADQIRWAQVNDEPFEYAIQQDPHGDEFVKLLDGSCLRRALQPSRAGREEIARREVLRSAIFQYITSDTKDARSELTVSDIDGLTDAILSLPAVQERRVPEGEDDAERIEIASAIESFVANPQVSQQYLGSIEPGFEIRRDLPHDYKSGFWFSSVAVEAILRTLSASPPAPPSEGGWLDAAALKLRELHQEDRWSTKDVRRGVDEWIARLDCYDGCALVRLEVTAHDRVLLAELLRALPAPPVAGPKT